MIQESDCDEIWLRLVYESSSCSINHSCQEDIPSVFLSLCLYSWQGRNSDTALYPALLLNIYTLVKHIKLTAGAHITARQRSQIQYGSHSLPRICVLNKESYRDRQTDRQMGLKAFTLLSKCPMVNWELFLGFCFLSSVESNRSLKSHVRMCKTSQPILFNIHRTVLIDYVQKC